MKYSYNWLKEYVPNLPESKKLVELLTMRAFEVENVEKAGDDWVLDIKVLPNRAFDCLSHLGMAREIAAITDSSFRPAGDHQKGGKFQEDKSLKVKDFLKVEVQDKKLCPRYSARVIADVKVSESPKWMQEKLMTCGLRPINNIVDITNYVMLEYGQPLHAFDFEKVSGAISNSRCFAKRNSPEDCFPISKQISNSKKPISKIIVRRAKKGEKITTLEGEERELRENILVIADEKDPIAIAGIKGGNKAEIDDKTTRIILESANFDPVSTRKSSKILNLRTDASIRFENGIDINLTVEAVNKAAALIAELGKGKIVMGVADAQAVKPKQVSTAAAHSYIESLLGIKIKQKGVLDILKRLGLSVKAIKKKGDVFYEVFVPSRRSDLNTSEDLIEEIGRLYGYENISSKMPSVVLAPAMKNDDLVIEDKAKNILSGIGYSEVYNYSLISESDKNIFGLDEQILTGPKNPLSQEQKYLRPVLLAGLVKNVKENFKYFDEVKLFEIGETFVLGGKEISERKILTGILARKKEKEDIFYEIKGVVDLLLDRLGISDHYYAEAGDMLGEVSGQKPFFSCGASVDKMTRGVFHSSRQARIVVGDNAIGWIGEVNKQILRELEIDYPVVGFSFNFDNLIKLIEKEIEYRAPSKYPAIERDLTVLVDAKVKVDEVLNIIENSGGSQVINVDLMDIYEGEHLGESEKSLTFKLVFQSYDKTLTDGEVNKSMEKIIKAVEDNGWEIRR